MHTYLIYLSSLFTLSHVQDFMERKKDIIAWVTRKSELEAKT